MQRSLTWTEGSDSSPNTIRVEGVDLASAVTQEQEQHDQEQCLQQQQHRLQQPGLQQEHLAEHTQQAQHAQEGQHEQQQLNVSQQGSMTVDDADSSQSSPSLQAPRRGAALHRQRLGGRASSGLDESGSGGSSSEHMAAVDSARFQAGLLHHHCHASLCTTESLCQSMQCLLPPVLCQWLLMVVRVKKKYSYHNLVLSCATAGHTSCSANTHINDALTQVCVTAGSQDGVNRSQWYSYNPMASVTTLATSASDGGSTLGGLDQSCADFVLMASPVRGDSLKD